MVSPIERIIHNWNGRENQLLSGRVSNSDSGILVSEIKFYPLHFHHVRFTVHGIPTHFTSRSEASINDGDMIVVCGRAKPGGFEAFAFRNLTNGSYGQEPRASSHDIGAISAVALGALTVSMLLAGEIAAAIFAAIAFCILPPPLLVSARRSRIALQRCLEYTEPSAR